MTYKTLTVIDYKNTVGIYREPTFIGVRQSAAYVDILLFLKNNLTEVITIHFKKEEQRLNYEGLAKDIAAFFNSESTRFEVNNNFLLKGKYPL